MDFVLEFIEQFSPSPRVIFYLMIAYAIVAVIATVAWCVSLFLEVTKKRASKLSIRYGSADTKENKIHVGKLVVQGLLLAALWVIFVIVF